MPKANRRIGELKRDITALGTPNIGAIDEFQRVNTRYTYLTDQRNDVEKAKALFARYDACRARLCRFLATGHSISQLYPAA